MLGALFRNAPVVSSPTGFDSHELTSAVGGISLWCWQGRVECIYGGAGEKASTKDNIRR